MSDYIICHYYRHNLWRSRWVVNLRYINSRASSFVSTAVAAITSLLLCMTTTVSAADSVTISKDNVPTRSHNWDDIRRSSSSISSINYYHDYGYVLLDYVSRVYYITLHKIYVMIIVHPLKRLYLNGPNINGFIGGWYGMSNSQICSQITKVSESMWDANPCECEKLIEKNFQGTLILFETCIYFFALFCFIKVLVIMLSKKMLYIFSRYTSKCNNKIIQSSVTTSDRDGCRSSCCLCCGVGGSGIDE